MSLTTKLRLRIISYSSMLYRKSLTFHQGVKLGETPTFVLTKNYDHTLGKVFTICSNAAKSFQHALKEEDAGIVYAYIMG